MSDERNSGYMVEDFYGEPFDIVKYIKPETADEFVVFLVDEALSFFEDNSFSPIIEQQKYDGFVIDYYFLADCLSKFIEEKILEKCGDKEIVKLARKKIKNDFMGEGPIFLKNGSLFLSILDFLDIIVFAKKGSGIYNRTVYSYFDEIGEQKAFVLSGVFLHKERKEEYYSILKRIGSKDSYKMEGFGKALAGVILKFQRKEIKVVQF